MWSVVGLGNPGGEYEATRHNVGFLVVERLACRWEATFGPRQRGSRVALTQFRGQPILLVEPLMFMNCSGDALARLDPSLQVSADECIVVHDDLDLDYGRVAIKKGGGTGGHRGLASIVEWGGGDFIRVRIGIGRPENADAINYVLGEFTAEERSSLRATIERAADAVEGVLVDGVARAMNKFNMRSTTTDSMPMGQRRE
jgi:peptidyl-tRNA hydrolase, PTH1 family